MFVIVNAEGMFLTPLGWDTECNRACCFTAPVAAEFLRAIPGTYALRVRIKARCYAQEHTREIAGFEGAN